MLLTSAASGKPFHLSVVAVPKSVRESATEPPGWSASAIRSTWRRNVG